MKPSLDWLGVRFSSGRDPGVSQDSLRRLSISVFSGAVVTGNTVPRHVPFDYLPTNLSTASDTGARKDLLKLWPASGTSMNSASRPSFFASAT